MSARAARAVGGGPLGTCEKDTRSDSGSGARGGRDPDLVSERTFAPAPRYVSAHPPREKRFTGYHHRCCISSPPCSCSSSSSSSSSFRRRRSLPRGRGGGGGEESCSSASAGMGERSAPRISSPLISREHSGATVLQLKHSSRLSRENKDYEHHLRYLLISDEERVSWLQSRIKRSVPNYFQKDSSETQIPLNSGIRLQTLNYVAAVGIGGKATTVIVDTGSDLTWVQCKPCVSCYTQQDPLFDPSLSPSYRSVPCNATACSSSLQAATGTSGICGNDRTSCYYLVSYGDGSYTRGVLAQERISLGETNVENFIFGCGRSNRGLFGGTSGLMGLGRTELSLVSQTTNQFGGVFSYCLPSRPYNSSGSLVLGSDLSVYKNSTPISYTRMISDPEQQPFYFLNLTGLRVGAVELRAPGFSNGKVLIDSGTVITRLAPSVYKALKDEFVRQFAAYPTAPGFSILDTCFNLSGMRK
uniref:Peptidase A1 domain-containing protein n=1 Tax=Ananas comosus var. bracteatus TaxID=296719 RepID=A0A6V7QBI0_ANACO|nr:unnamed protein product [Ananas comosus var. bracteatus]